MIVLSTQGHPSCCEECGHEGCIDCEDVTHCWTCDMSFCRRCNKVEACTLCPEVGSLRCRSCSARWKMRSHDYGAAAFGMQEECWDCDTVPPWHCRGCFKETHPADGSRPGDRKPGDPTPEGQTSEALAEAVGPVEPLSDPVPEAST
jgi:hypothetical protein